MTFLLALALVIPPAHRPARRAQTRKPAPRHAVHRPVRRHPVRRLPGIAPARALAIQHALMAVGYLDRASGRWDASTRRALLRLQRAHHWQTRFVPDARALIALGLGPAPATTASSVAPPPAKPAGGG